MVYPPTLAEDALLHQTGGGEHQKLAHCHHYGTEDDGATVAPVTVGDVASKQRGEIYQTGIGAENLACLSVVIERGNEIQHKQRAHSVIGEALGHLSNKEKI